MSIQVQRNFLFSQLVKDCLKKLSEQNLPYKERSALLKLIRARDEELRHTQEVLKNCHSKENEDGQEELKEFLRENLELPKLPVSILENDNLKLSANDQMVLEFFIET